MKLTRVVIIEKHKHDDFPKFPYNNKGLIHCNAFIQGLGGWKKVTGERNRKWFNNADKSVFTANHIWEKMKNKNYGNRH